MKEPEKVVLKVLRVEASKHQLAKINATKKGLKMQLYIEQLIEADEKGLIDWGKSKEEIAG